MRRKSRRENPSQNEERGESDPETVSIEKSSPPPGPYQLPLETQSRAGGDRESVEPGPLEVVLPHNLTNTLQKYHVP